MFLVLFRRYFLFSLSYIVIHDHISYAVNLSCFKKKDVVAVVVVADESAKSFSVMT